MYQSKSILAIVTARGGSKGIPGKNWKPLCGKPLIAWTIEAAKRSRYVDQILVSTDHEELRKISVEYGAKAPFLRPREFSDDLSKQEDAIKHAMQWVEVNEKKYDYIVLLMPTTPLRSEQDIDAVIEYLIRHDSAKAVCTVIPCDHSPLFSNRLPKDLCMKDFIPINLRHKNRQELPQYYQLSGAVWMSTWDYFLEQHSFLGPETYAFVTTGRNGIDIDSMIDFLVAEAYMTHPEIK